MLTITNMAEPEIHELLSLLEQAKAIYQSRLAAAIPYLLDRALTIMRERGVAIQLSGEFNPNGQYQDPTKGKMNENGLYFAFPDGIICMKTLYDRTGNPRTKEVPVPRQEFLRWAAQKLERAEDVYRRLNDYKRVPAFGPDFPDSDMV